MHEYTLIQFIDRGWEIYLEDKIVTDYLRQYVDIHDEALTKDEALWLIEQTNNMHINLEVAA